MRFILDNPPLWFICLAMIVAAVIDGWKLKVPNWLTFPLVLSGWALGLAHDFDWLAGTGEGGIGASLAGTALGFALLFPVYAIGGMGAGDVKMQMGFGAWIGAFYGLSSVPNEHPGALWIVLWAFCLATVIGGVLALGMILVRGQVRKNLSNTRAILGDLFGAGVGTAADNAAQRKSRMHLLPYGIPLCLGFLSYLIILHWQRS
jgi:prepilin peptidase CpaA